MCPSAEASCSKRWFSSFAAVWRLKSFVFPKPTSKTSEFICSLPDYPNVSVAIPWNSLPADTDFSLTLKVFTPDVAFVRNNNDDDNNDEIYCHHYRYHSHHYYYIDHLFQKT